MLKFSFIECIYSRKLAETSPYFEALKEKDIEVLFLYESYDETVLQNLGQFDNKKLMSVGSDTDTVDATGWSSLFSFLKAVVLNCVQRHPGMIPVLKHWRIRLTSLQYLIILNVKLC